MRRPSATTARAAAVAVLAAASVAACGIGGSTATTSNALAGPTGTPITVGMSVSLTGPFSADGQAVLKGYQLWASDVNSQGGLLGRPVKLVYLNDNSDPGTTTKDYTKLITQDHVDLTLGPFSSLLTVPAGIVANKHHYAFVEGSGGAPSVFAQKLPNLFAVSAPVANQMVPFAKWVASLPPAQPPQDRRVRDGGRPVRRPAADPGEDHPGRLPGSPASTTTPALATRDRPVSRTSRTPRPAWFLPPSSRPRRTSSCRCVRRSS